MPNHSRQKPIITKNTTDSIKATSVNTNTKSSNPGEEAEKKGLEFIKRNLPSGWTAIARGSNPKLSDIEIFDDKGLSKGFIEVKQLDARAGQFVVFQENNRWISKDENPFTAAALEILNNRAPEYKPTKMPSSIEENNVVWKWTTHHWESKKIIGFYLTDAKGSYEKLINVEELKEEVDLLFDQPYKKRSGTGRPSKEDQIEFEQKFHELFPNATLNIERRRIEGKNRLFIKPSVEVGEGFSLSNSNLFFSRNSKHTNSPQEIEVNRKAVTENYNCLISISLKGQKKSTPPEDIKKFFRNIR